MLDFHYKNVGEDEQVLLFVISGSLDTMHCEYLHSVIEKQIQRGHTRLVLDCTDLTYVSSMGLGMMLRVHAKMKKLGGDVRLAGVQGTVADIVKLVRLDKILHMYSTVDEAVAELDDDAATE